MPINTRKEGNPLVGIVGGSTSDFPILKKSVELLNHLEVESELRVVSAPVSYTHLTLPTNREV